jgi:hypothetical protein
LKTQHLRFLCVPLKIFVLASKNPGLSQNVCTILHFAASLKSKTLRISQNPCRFPEIHAHFSKPRGMVGHSKLLLTARIKIIGRAHTSNIMAQISGDDSHTQLCTVNNKHKYG